MRVACIFFKTPIEITHFAQACLRFSPQISVRHPHAVFVEIGKCASLYSEESFRARVLRLLDRFQAKAAISISTDIPSALALARFNLRDIDQLPIEGLLDFGDPFGIDPDARDSIEKMVLALRRLGVTRFGRFKAIPQSDLPSRFGRWAQRAVQLLTDASALAWPQWHPPERFAESLDLASTEQCCDLEPLLFRSKMLLDRLFSRLRGSHLQADKIEFGIEIEKTSVTQVPARIWSFELISPQRSTAGFLPILHERLNWDLSTAPLEGPAIKVTCVVCSTSVSRGGQRHLFTARDDFDEQMGSFFGQMQEYLGKGNVFWADVTEERLPEKSWLKSQAATASSISLGGKYPLRPSRLFGSPIPITVMQDRVVIRGRIYKSLAWSTVERISVGWLDHTQPRNYYRVELEGGRSIWVFSDPEHHYFIHGYFE